MNELLAQIILARNDDGQGWMNILVVVAIAIVYGLSSILKAKAKKAEEQEQEEEQLTRKPARKPPVGGRDLREQSLKQARRPAGPTPGRPYRPGVQQPRAEVAGAPRAVEKFAPEAEEPSGLATIEPLAEPELSLPSSKVQPDFEELPELRVEIQGLPEFTSKAFKGLGTRRGAIPAEMAEAEHLPEILSDYDDPEELRRAILHYEILGRPLSLRDPSGRIIGL